MSVDNLIKIFGFFLGQILKRGAAAKQGSAKVRFFRERDRLQATGCCESVNLSTRFAKSRERGGAGPSIIGI
ncbi:MAG: hypothetical protein KJO30_15625, partial [Boseongicola sp.]|nr:hypothetical protein [Boseongicola sp.]